MKKTTLIQKLTQRVFIAGLAVAGLSISTQAQSVSPAVTNVWRLAAGVEYDFAAAADGFVRGVGINPVNGNVLFATRAAGSNHIAVIDAATGFVSNRLSGVGVSGGTINLVGVKVADDGAVYGAGLAIAGVNAGSILKIYRWDSDTSLLDPTNVCTILTNATRYGDSMDIRGAGTNTQILMTGSGGNRIALFTTKDGINFNAETNEVGVLTNYISEILYPAGISAGDLGKGVAFDGTNNALYGKNFGVTSMRYVTYNPTALTATNVANVVIDNRFCGLDLITVGGFKVAGGVLAGSGAALAADQHRARFWDVTVTNAPQLIFDDPLPAPVPPTTYIANANAIGAACAKNGKIAVLEPNNAIALYQVYLVTNPPPSITAQPVGNTNVLTGGFYNVVVSASGGSLRYQWRLNGSAVASATNATLALTNIIVAQAGDYSVVITNAGGSVTSSVATIGLQPSVLTTESAKLWQLTPGSRSYLATDNNQRGVAYNKLSNRILVANRTGGPSVNVLNADTGANITNLNMTGVIDQAGALSGFQIVSIGAADDGAVYACNLTTAGPGFTIYRWSSDSTINPPVLAYGPADPTGSGFRFGDTLSVQGSGVNTKILAASRAGTVVVVFTTADGINFTANPVDVSTAPTPAPPGFAGLGLAAGAGDSFWATSGGFQLRKVVYDLVNNTNDVVISKGGQTGNNIGVDEVNGFVAAIGTADVPSNLRILDVSDAASATAVLVDQEFFGSDNDNGNGTGAVAFDVAGGRVFALDTNNGLIALKYAPRLKQNGNVLSWTGPGVLQAATAANGTYNDIVGSTSPYTTNTTGAVFFKVRR